MVGDLTIPLSPEDRALLLRMPCSHTVPQAWNSAAPAERAMLTRVDALKRRGLVRIDLDTEASTARHVVRKLNITADGLLALHGRG